MADRGGEVAPEERPFIDFVIHVDDNDIAFLKGINHPLVRSPGKPLGLRDFRHALGIIGTGWRIDRGHGTANQFPVDLSFLGELRMQGLHGNELVLISPHEKRFPDFFKRHGTERVEIGISYFRTSIGKTLPFPCRRDGLHHLWIIELHLPAP